MPDPYKSYQDVQQYTVAQLKADKDLVLQQMKNDNTSDKAMKAFKTFYDDAIKKVSNLPGQTISLSDADYAKKVMAVIEPLVEKLSRDAAKGTAPGPMVGTHFKNTQEFVSNLEKSLQNRPKNPYLATQYGGRMEKPEKYGYPANKEPEPQRPDDSKRTPGKR